MLLQRVRGGIARAHSFGPAIVAVVGGRQRRGGRCFGGPLYAHDRGGELLLDACAREDMGKSREAEGVGVSPVGIVEQVLVYLVVYSPSIALTQNKVASYSAQARTRYNLLLRKKSPQDGTRKLKR